MKKDQPIQNFDKFITCFNNDHFLGEEHTFSSEHGAHFVIFLSFTVFETNPCVGCA